MLLSPPAREGEVKEAKRGTTKAKRGEDEGGGGAWGVISEASPPLSLSLTLSFTLATRLLGHN